MLIVLAFHPIHIAFYSQKCFCLSDNLVTLSILLESERRERAEVEQSIRLDDKIKRDNLMFSWEPGTTQFSLDPIEAISL